MSSFFFKATEGPMNSKENCFFFLALGAFSSGASSSSSSSSSFSLICFGGMVGMSSMLLMTILFELSSSLTKESSDKGGKSGPFLAPLLACRFIMSFASSSFCTTLSTFPATTLLGLWVLLLLLVLRFFFFLCFLSEDLLLERSYDEMDLDLDLE